MNVIVPGTTRQVHIERNNKNSEWRFYNSNNAKKYELLNRNTETPRIKNVGSVNQRVAKKVANTLVWHARKGMLTGIWSPNKIVRIMNARREVPTNYSNALKENIRTKINARANINSDRKKRALGALNVLFNKKPVLRPEPEDNANGNTFYNTKQTFNEKNNNSATQSYRQHRETYGN